MVTFRRESRGYQRVQQEDRVSNQPSDQETQPKSKLLIKQTLKKPNLPSVQERDRATIRIAKSK